MEITMFGTIFFGPDVGATIDKVVLEWFQDVQLQKMSVSRGMLQEKPLEVSKGLETWNI